MKFRDIEQYIECSGYNVSVGLDYLQETIDQYLKDGLVLNPDFQRGHVWTEQQQISFVEHLLRGGTSGLDIYLNHPNFGKYAEDGDFVCVDGLQRITACLLFLNNQIPAFGQYLSDFGERPPVMIRLKINVNNLQTRAEVLDWYIQMNSGGTVHSQEEIERVKALLKQEKQAK